MRLLFNSCMHVGVIARAIRSTCPSLLQANRCNQYVYEDEEVQQTVKDDLNDNFNLDTPLGFEYDPTHVLSAAGGMSMFNLSVRIQAGLDINDEDLKFARSELRERAMECKLTNKQFEYETLNLESGYTVSITIVRSKLNE